MPVVIQKGVGKKAAPLTLTAELIRDLLLSLSDNERRFVITDPATGGRKVYSIRKNTAGNLEYTQNSEIES